MCTSSNGLIWQILAWFLTCWSWKFCMCYRKYMYILYVIFCPNNIILTYFVFMHTLEVFMCWQIYVRDQTCCRSCVHKSIIYPIFFSLVVNSVMWSVTYQSIIIRIYSFVLRNEQCAECKYTYITKPREKNSHKIRYIYLNGEILLHYGIFKFSSLLIVSLYRKI